MNKVFIVIVLIVLAAYLFLVFAPYSTPPGF